MNEENLNQAPQPTAQPTGSAQMQDFNNTYKNDTGKKRNKGLVILLAILCPLALFGIALALILPRLGHDAPDPGPNPLPIPISYENNGAFSLDFLRQAYATDQRGGNILVSPYSMESVWRLALPGANGETQQEISTALGGERTMKKFPQLKVANAMFVRDSFAPQVKPEFTANFDGDLRYDSFASAEPINSWVKENTDGMIDGVLDQAPDNEMMIMLLNAIAMDEKWSDKFECDNTMSAEFTKTSGDTMDVSMMGGSAERYFKTENAEGVVREYKAYDDGSAFEFVGILPNGSVREYTQCQTLWV